MEAKLKYLSQSYEMIEFSTYVLCAITGKHIPLEELKYWSVERQEAYIDVHTSLKRELELSLYDYKPENIKLINIVTK
jgi:hypothetical protein